MGGHEWRAFIGHGHAPEHLSLYCEALNVVIAGDMLLSTISNQRQRLVDRPEGDPLRLFLESLKPTASCRERAGASLRTASLSAARTFAWRTGGAPRRTFHK